jgi:hypothetical protein
MPWHPHPHMSVVHQVKRRLWAGGIQRSNKPEGRRATPGLKDWDDLVGAGGGAGGWLMRGEAKAMAHRTEQLPPHIMLPATMQGRWACLDVCSTRLLDCPTTCWPCLSSFR